MAKQTKTTETITNNANNVSRVAALFSMLPVAIQELLHEADARNESLDFSAIPVFTSVPKSAEWGFRTLADLEPIPPTLFKSIVAVADKLASEAKGITPTWDDTFLPAFNVFACKHPVRFGENELEDKRTAGKKTKFVVLKMENQKLGGRTELWLLPHVAYSLFKAFSSPEFQEAFMAMIRKQGLQNPVPQKKESANTTRYAEVDY